jgi:aspartyl-tRNA(Asn)/glutamyl-tRNA(Gln) amidotransferase subunit C
MKITTEDIERLARLARIEVKEEEKSAFQNDLNSIFTYISEIQEVALDQEVVVYSQANVFRDDVVTNLKNQYTQDILEQAPERKGDYLQVDQVII